MKKYLPIRFFLLIALIGIMLPSCNPKTTKKASEQTDECALKEEVCKEAFDFQREYEQLPEEEKKDMASVMETYRVHCEEAKKKCEKSKK
jgi:hypothetical protein